VWLARYNKEIIWKPVCVRDHLYINKMAGMVKLALV
jgi:hypothetical protein